MQTAQLNSYDAARAVGVTYRQLDHWLRIGVARSTRAARGSGSHRRFSRRDVMLLAAVAELMRLGAGTESAARLWAFLDGLDGGRWPRAVVVTPGSLCVPAAGELPPSGWYVDVAAAVDQAGAALLDTILEKVG